MEALIACIALTTMAALAAFCFWYSHRVRDRQDGSLAQCWQQTQAANYASNLQMQAQTQQLVKYFHDLFLSNDKKPECDDPECKCHGE